MSGARCGQCGAAVQIRGWMVQRILATPATGRVYLGRDRSRQTAVIKEMIPTPGRDQDQVERFRREGNILRSLSHGSIPRFIDAFVEEDGLQRRHFLAYEYVEGRTLLEWLADGPFSEVEAEDVARDLLEVLHYLHGQTPPIIHRDVRPMNLIIGKAGRLMLVEFGAARPLERNTSPRQSFTGTPGYTPPEHIAGVFDQTTDLYSAGATLVHLLTGKAPNELYTPGLELDFKRHVRSPTWAGFLGKLVARQPRERFQSARDALFALNSTLRGTGEHRRVRS